MYFCMKYMSFLCSFLHSLHDVLHLFMYIYLHFHAPALPLYFLALMWLRKVVNCVVPSKAGQDPLNIPTMFGSFGEMLLSIVLRTCGIEPLCFIHSPSSFSLLCSALILPFPSHCIVITAHIQLPPRQLPQKT